MAMQAETTPATGPGAAQSQAAEDVDWSSVDQVANMVSRTTMAAMQQLWRQHASGMDELGRLYAERMYESHLQTVREIAEVKNFDLRRVLGVLNGFTEATRELVLSVLQDIKVRDDDFTQQLYQTTRGAFARNLRAALEARDAWYREKLRGLRQRHDAQLAAVRHAAAVELQQRQMQLKIALARTLAKSARSENPSAILNILTSRTGTELGIHAPPVAPTITAAGAVAIENNSTGSGTGPGAAPAAGVATAAAGLTEAAISVRSTGTISPQPLGAGGDGAAAAAAGGGGGGALGSVAPPADLGPEAAILEELFEDANAADALNRELEAALSRANAELLDLREKVEAAQAAAQDAAADAAQWRSKWVVEATKSDSIKRESMAIIAKCEEHLTQLQQHHIAEISQRDYLLQRCRDTIGNLEARLPAAPMPSLVPGPSLAPGQAITPGMSLVGGASGNV